MVRTPARAVTALLLALSLLVPVPASRAVALEDDWPAAFDPLVLRSLHLSLDPRDWDTIRRDTTNEIEVPAMFWADGEEPLLVSVKRKSSRALPSESDPIKVGLKIDVNEYVDDQLWHGLAKLSLENGADSGVVQEGLAWNMHRFAAGEAGYGYDAAFASWVNLTVNADNIGVYVNAEQRDKQALRQRGLWVADVTWLYEQDGGEVILEEGDPDSPALAALCYSPFRAKGKGSCPRPPDAELEAELRDWLDMDGLLAQCAVEALTDNTDALCSHGKNTFFADFSLGRMEADGLRRIYLPWDLDTVFHDPESNIYALRSGRRIVQNVYEEATLNHATIRAQYNAKIFGLTDPASGPLSEAELHAFLDQVSTVVGPALALDPYPAEEDVPGVFDELKAFLTARIASARAQATANTDPPPRD